MLALSDPTTIVMNIILVGAGFAVMVPAGVRDRNRHLSGEKISKTQLADPDNLSPLAFPGITPNTPKPTTKKDKKNRTASSAPPALPQVRGMGENVSSPSSAWGSPPFKTTIGTKSNSSKEPLGFQPSDMPWCKDLLKDNDPDCDVSETKCNFGPSKSPLADGAWTKEDYSRSMFCT